MTTPETVVDPAGLRGNRNFRLLWTGEAVSLLGNATSAVLLPLLAVVTLHAGPGWMGALTAATWLPWLLVGLPAGAWVDVLPVRAVMIAADVAAAVALGSVPVAQWAGVLTLTQLLAVALVTGTATVFFRTAYAGLIPSVVAQRDLERANARLFGTESAAQVAGPGLAGALAQFLSAALGVVLDAASFLVSALCLWRMRVVRRVEPAAGPSLRSRIAEGVGFVVRDRFLRWMTVIGGVSNFGLTGLNTLMVLFLVDEIGLPPSGVGLVLTAASIGGLAGAAVAPWMSNRFGSGRASTWALVLSGPPAALVAAGGPGWSVGWVVAGLAGLGAFVVAGNVIRGAWRQRYVPAALLGRVISSCQLFNYGTMPLGALTAGGLATQFGLRPALLTMAGIHLVACLSLLVSPFSRLRELPAACPPVPLSANVSVTRE